MKNIQLFKELIKQVKFRNWDEAFRGLTPSMRQHSVRVADYTQVLFSAACKAADYLNDPETPDYMDEAYAEVAYKCGFYHQIGKALEPEYYTEWDDSMDDDEKSRYCKYVVEGKDLVARLQGESRDTVNISCAMIQDACEYHMERWDGSGFPYGYEGNEISLIAQIVGLAKEFDRLICERRSETPFEDAIDIILQKQEEKFSPMLLEVFVSHQEELKVIYKKYIQYTKTMPKTVALVEKRPDRPLGLTYRQIVTSEEIGKNYYEAVPWFGGVADAPEKRETAAEAEAMLLRSGLLHDLTMYFLYEAADLLARIKNCELNTAGVLVPIYTAFYEGENKSAELEQFYEDTAIDRKKMLLLVPESLLRKNRANDERLMEYIEQGVSLVLDDYHPEKISMESVREIGFTRVRLAKDSSANALEMAQELKRHGITAIDYPAGDTDMTEDALVHYLLGHDS